MWSKMKVGFYLLTTERQSHNTRAFENLGVKSIAWRSFTRCIMLLGGREGTMICYAILRTVTRREGVSETVNLGNVKKTVWTVNSQSTILIFEETSRYTSE